MILSLNCNGVVEKYQQQLINSWNLNEFKVIMKIIAIVKYFIISLIIYVLTIAIYLALYFERSSSVT